MENLSRRMASIQHFELPPLPDNLAFSCHPSFARICKKTDEWIISKLNITDEGQMKKIVESRMGMFASMMHPHGSEEHIILITKHLWVMFMVDDVLESSTMEAYMELKPIVWDMANGVLLKPLRYDQYPCLALYDDIMVELRNALSPALFSRYLKVLAIYLDALGHEIDHTLVESSVPSPDVYRKLRRDTGFMEVIGGIMTEFCLGLELKREDTQSPDFLELIDCISDHVCLVNDLLSFRKELYEKPGSYSHNWLAVVFHHSKTNTFQDAVYKLRDMIQDEEDKILSLQKRLITKAHAENDEHLFRFAHAFPTVAAGHLHWSYITGRYHGYNNTLLTGEMFHGTWFLHPGATIVMPAKSVDKHEYLISA